MKYFIYIVITVVAGSIVAGFFIVDSPAETRLRKFDEQRISDLSFIQSEIINYWTRKGELPEGLDKLKDDIRGVSIPVDPQTKEKYEYEIKSKDTFLLCANFARETFIMTSNAKPVPARYSPFGGYQNDSWEHLKGRGCFSRTIDPELYPVNKPEVKRPR